MSRQLTYRRLFQTLNACGCGYIVVGGLAVILHGHPRLTTDTDLVVDLAAESIDKLMNALAELGFKPRVPVDLAEFAEPEKRRAWIDEKHMQAFSLFHPDQPAWVIDLLIDIPADFATLAENVEIKQVEGERVPVAAIDDLIRMKQSAGREIDRQDIGFLRQIRELQAKYRVEPHGNG